MPPESVTQKETGQVHLTTEMRLVPESDRRLPTWHTFHFGHKLLLTQLHTVDGDDSVRFSSDYEGVGIRGTGNDALVRKKEPESILRRHQREY